MARVAVPFFNIDNVDDTVKKYAQGNLDLEDLLKYTLNNNINVTMVNPGNQRTFESCSLTMPFNEENKKYILALLANIGDKGYKFSFDNKKGTPEVTIEETTTLKTSGRSELFKDTLNTIKDYNSIRDYYNILSPELKNFYDVLENRNENKNLDTPTTNMSYETKDGVQEFKMDNTSNRYGSMANEAGLDKENKEFGNEYVLESDNKEEVQDKMQDLATNATGEVDNDYNKMGEYNNQYVDANTYNDFISTLNSKLQPHDGEMIFTTITFSDTEPKKCVGKIYSKKSTEDQLIYNFECNYSDDIQEYLIYPILNSYANNSEALTSQITPTDTGNANVVITDGTRIVLAVNNISLVKAQSMANMIEQVKEVDKDKEKERELEGPVLKRKKPEEFNGFTDTLSYLSLVAVLIVIAVILAIIIV